MVTACNNRLPGRGSGPVLSGPSEAARVIRLSVAREEKRAIVLLLCGARHELLLAVTVDGAPVSALRQAVGLVLQVAESGGVAGLVVGLVRHTGGRLSSADASALRGLVARCEAAGVDLLDVLVVGHRRWRSLWDLAELPAEGEDGDP